MALRERGSLLRGYQSNAERLCRIPLTHRSCGVNAKAFAGLAAQSNDWGEPGRTADSLKVLHSPDLFLSSLIGVTHVQTGRFQTSRHAHRIGERSHGAC